VRVLAVTPADSDRASTWTWPSRRASQRLSSRWTGHPELVSTTPETRAIEPDDVELDDVELDDVELDDVELDDVELDDVELDDVELGGVEPDGPADGAPAGRTPHEAHARTMTTVASSHLTRGPSRRIVVVTDTWTPAGAIRFRRRTLPRSRRGPCPGLAGDPAGLDAGGAHVQALGRTAYDDAPALDVRVPAAGGAAVRERDVVAEARPLAADVADGSHGSLQC